MAQYEVYTNQGIFTIKADFMEHSGSNGLERGTSSVLFFKQKNISKQRKLIAEFVNPSVIIRK